MTYQQARAVLQLIADEEVGRPMRDAQRLEDKRLAGSLAALKVEQDRHGVR